MNSKEILLDETLVSTELALPDMNLGKIRIEWSGAEGYAESGCCQASGNKEPCSFFDCSPEEDCDRCPAYSSFTIRRFKYEEGQIFLDGTRIGNLWAEERYYWGDPTRYYAGISLPAKFLVGTDEYSNKTYNVAGVEFSTRCIHASRNYDYFLSVHDTQKAGR